MTTITTTLYPDYDNVASTAYVDTNGNAYDRIRVGEGESSSDKYRSWLKFDLSEIPVNSIVTTATLRLKVITDESSNAGGVTNVYRCKRAWVSNQATWNIWKTGSNWSTAGGFHADDCEQTEIGTLATGASSSGWLEWDLDTDAIEEMISGAFTNNGFMLKTAAESNDCYAYKSLEYASEHPELYLEYELSAQVFQSIVIA